MKKLLFIIGFLFISVLTFSQGFGPENSKSMKPIVQNMWDNVINTVETQNGYEIVRLEFDIIKTDSKDSYRILSNLYTYRVGVIGDPDKEDYMKVEVYKRLDDGTYIYVTSKFDAVSAFVDFTPTSTGYYKFVISATFKPGYAGCHYGLVILHQ